MLNLAISAHNRLQQGDSPVGCRIYLSRAMRRESVGSRLASKEMTLWVVGATSEKRAGALYTQALYNSPPYEQNCFCLGTNIQLFRTANFLVVEQGLACACRLQIGLQPLGYVTTRSTVGSANSA